MSYFPLVQPYVWAIDDYPLAQMAQVGMGEYLQDAFQRRGIWRVLQHGLVGWVVNHGAWLPGLLAICLHAITCQFFYLVLCRTCRRREGALLLAIIAACAPFGFQAIVWTSALPYVFSSLVLWVSLWMFLQMDSIPKWAWLIWGLVFAASLLIHEHLIFAMAFVSGAAWMLSSEGGAWKSWLKPSLRWGPPLVAGLYLVAYVVWKPTDHLLYMEPHFHWPTLISPLARLWQWPDIWAACFNSDLWQMAASEWPWGRLGLGCCLIGGITSLWVMPSLPDGAPEISQVNDKKVMMAVLLLFLLAGLIYVSAGGYALDSRKRYPLFLFVLAGGGVWALSWKRMGVLFLQGWKRKVAASALVAVLMMTCWLQTGLWRAEARATRLLSDFLAAHPNFHRVQAQKLFDPEKMCPSVVRLHGQPWINTEYVGQPFVLDHPGQTPPEIMAEPAPDVPLLVYDYRSREWKVSPTR